VEWAEGGGGSNIAPCSDGSAPLEDVDTRFSRLSRPSVGAKLFPCGCELACRSSVGDLAEVAAGWTEAAATLAGSLARTAGDADVPLAPKAWTEVGEESARLLATEEAAC
jgi:hypothetical protein